jgi:hypothetical protein
MPSLPMVLVLVFKVEEGLSSSDVRASGSKANSDDDFFEGLSRVSSLRMTFGVHMEFISGSKVGRKKSE